MGLVELTLKFSIYPYIDICNISSTLTDLLINESFIYDNKSILFIF